MADIQYLCQNEFSNSEEWKIVKRAGDKVLVYINSKQKEIHSANQPGKGSQGIEEILKPELEVIGFSHVPMGEYPDQSLRPDFVSRKLKTIVEVERGKILNNNMDMLDFWKTHIHEECRYLILIVPINLKHSEKHQSKPFEKVKQRLSIFFKEKNKTNVRGLVIIGY